MILHILPDSFFSDVAFREFERVAPGLNDYVVISRNTNLKWVTSTKIRLIPSGSIQERSLVQTLANYEALIVHSLDIKNATIINKAPPQLKILWVGWGCDYYSLIEKKGENSLFLEKTLAAYKRNRTLKDSFYSFGIFLLNKVKASHKTILNALRRIDFFSPVLPGEFNLIKKEIKGFRAKYISWNYGCLEDYAIPGKTVCGNNVLIGNSATYTSNHLDAFTILKNVKFSGKILVPLSYGDENYTDIVVKEGKKLFQGNFEPITKFLTLNEYADYGSQCSFLLMNHLRQQGLGNIIMMMSMGATIVLHPINPICEFLKSYGAFFFTTEYLESVGSFEKIELTVQQIRKNKEILEKLWGRESKNCRTEKLIVELIGK